MKCYIGIKPCGCVCSAIVENTDKVEEVLMDWRERGLKISYVPVEEARIRLKICNHKTQKGEEKGK